MKMCKTKPIRIIPMLLYPILAGYHGLDGGLGVSWLGCLLKIVLPRIERSENLMKRFAHAAGALNDIEILVTSCVPVNASEETYKLAEAILRRSLASAHAKHCIPSWFVHEWERHLWEEFELGHIHACGTD